MKSVISSWIARRKKKQAEELYVCGYDYAAGALLRGEKTPLMLDAEISAFDKNLFDEGMNEAMRRVCNLNIVEDDRV